MKLVQVAEANKKYYSKDFIHGFNTRAKTQLEADKKEMLRLGRWEKIELYAPSGDYVMFQCSECASLYYETSSYCPNCGAQMEASE